MNVDSAGSLREWILKLEQMLQAPISISDSGSAVLRTKGGALFGIEPIPGDASLVFTGRIGTVDAAMTVKTLKALLAVNMSPGLSGFACVGLTPGNDDILLRLIWTPSEAGWTEGAFASILAAFAEHVDALAAALANGEIEKILSVSSVAEESAPNLRSDNETRV
ncbi:MAG: type III secretion system chaperone [Candidimonas sp.]|jgi:hypothetical protein